MRLTSLIGGFALVAVSFSASATSLSFAAFVTAADISAAENGQHNTIGFTFAGDKFVGSVYFGADNTQLYSTDLTGHNVQKFGSPMPTGGDEVVVAGSLGQSGFGAGQVYAAPDNKIYKYGPSGGVPTLFSTLPSTIRFLFFDPGSTFGGHLLASTNTGLIYQIDSLGNASLLANLGTDTEGLDVIPLSAAGIWGAYAGDLIAATESAHRLYFIRPDGTFSTAPGVNIDAFESINFIPTSFSGNPLEGYYAANFPVDIQKASADQFAGHGGDLLATTEYGSNAPLTYVHYDLATNSFSTSAAGNLPDQAEDGLFLTAQKIEDTVPEPGTILLTGLGAVAALAFARRKRSV